MKDEDANTLQVIARAAADWGCDGDVAAFINLLGLNVQRLEREVARPVAYLHCHACGKQVSTGFKPVPTDTPDQGLIVRAWIECPECIEKRPS